MKTENKASSFIINFNNILNVSTPPMQNRTWEDIIKLDRNKGKIYIFDKEKF